MSTEAKQWIPRGKPFQPEKAGDSESGLPAILEHLVLERGLAEPDQLEAYLQPRLSDLNDPMLIPGMEVAVERILEAVDGKQQVCIYGDYDVDGVSSITLMRRVLQAYDLDPKHFIPKRAAEGYGLSEAALARCLKENGKPDLIEGAKARKDAILAEPSRAAIDPVTDARIRQNFPIKLHL